MAKRLEWHEDYDHLLLPALRTLFVDIGLQSMVWPEQNGGSGLYTRETALTMAAVLEQVGRADVGIGFLIANQMAILSTVGIEPYRNESLLTQLQSWFCRTSEPVICSLILPDYGEDSTKSDGEWRGFSYPVMTKWNAEAWELSGTSVRPQAAGATAKLFGVIGPDEQGQPAFFLFPGHDEGLQRGEPFKKTGLAASINADLTLEAVKIPADHLVFAGEDRCREMLAWYYLGCAATCQGAMSAAWDILRDWEESRVIKGKGMVFKENPLVAALSGEIGGAIGASRLLVYDLARMIAKPEDYNSPNSQALFATATMVARQVVASATRSIHQAMELMASAGYATEWQLERYWRDVKTIESCLGPATAAQVDMARHYFGLESL